MNVDTQGISMYEAFQLSHVAIVAFVMMYNKNQWTKVYDQMFIQVFHIYRSLTLK